MTICIPIEVENGARSEVSLSFFAAPKLIIVDPSTNDMQVLDDGDVDPKPPVDELAALLKERDVTGVVVGGIDLVSLHALEDVGIQVFSSSEETVGAIVSAFNDGTLQPVKLEGRCASHRTGRGFSGFGCGGCG